MKYKKIFSLAFSVGLCFSCLAQHETVPLGGDISGPGGSVSYSLGQVYYTTHVGPTGSIAQGVQQPYTIQIISGTEESIGTHIDLSAYPNPTNGFLILKIENHSYENISYAVFDISGKLMEERKLQGYQTGINMSNFSNATYFLKVYHKSLELKTFKIVKLI